MNSKVDGVFPPAATEQHALSQLDRIAASLGQKLRTADWSDFFQQHNGGVSQCILLTSDVIAPHVIIETNNHCESTYALMSDFGHLFVIRWDELRDFDFNKAIWSEGICESGELRRSRESVSAKKLWKALGVIQPNSTIDVSFSLQNVTEDLVCIKDVRSGCTCVQSSLISGTVLAPFETIALDLSVSVGRGPIVHEDIVVQVERAGLTPEEISLSCYGWIPGVMEVNPPEIDFGQVQDVLQSETIRLTETQFDQFDIVSVEVGDVPIEVGQLEESGTPGRREFRFTLQLVPAQASDIDESEFAGEIEILTTSNYFPIVTVPVRYQLPQHVIAIPAYVDFGIIDGTGAGEPHTVKLVHVGKKKLTTIDAKSSSSRIGIATNDSGTITITPERSVLGFFSADVIVHAQWDGGDCEARIRCTGLVRE